MTTAKYLPYRGEIQALATPEASGQLAFVTVHAESRPTAVYRLDAEKLTLDAVELPCGGRAIVADGDTLWVAGTDGRVYRLAPKEKSPAPIGPTFDPPVGGFALLAHNRLAALSGERVLLLSRQTGDTVQTLSLAEPSVCLASDPLGEWLVVGGAKGNVAVFTCEDKDEFVLSESDKLHEGAVTALLFEPAELRFFSAGLDQKLLLTHARGKLEPEDRGRGGSHSERLTAMILAPGDRFLTGGHDATVKTWTRVGAARPATLKDGVGKVIGLAIVTVHNRQQLVVACQDNTLRLFLIDAAGKFGQPTAIVHDVYAWADHEFQQNDAVVRESAIKKLAELNDIPAVERLTRRVAEDGDHGLRLLAARFLADSPHPRAAGELEKHLQHRDEAVRVAVFQGLRKQQGPEDLRPMDLALGTGKVEIGVAAVKALEELAAKDDQALTRLVRALDGKAYEVRAAALAALECIHGEGSATADLLALESRQADIRRLALVRLFQRNLLDQPQVPAAVRRAGEDADPRVRQTAFLVTASLRPSLVQTLRQRDPELDRQYVELENYDQEAETKGAVPAGDATNKVQAKEKKPAKKKKAAKPPAVSLTPADYEPLLQASASRMLDTCLRGARGLALLDDPRALGLLMQLSREQDAAARVEVCRALGSLDDPRSVKRLRSLLGDKAPEVRDAAFTALAQIYDDEPLFAAEAGLGANQEDVRRRGLEILVREVRKKPPQSPEQTGWDLLRRALNDTFPGVRGEAFKAALNLNLGGGGAATLRFVLGSVHEDVRREALTEIMAQVQGDQPWSRELLFECFNDPAQTLRSEAFAFAAKRAKGGDMSYLEAALVSRYDDIRREAVTALIKKHTQAAQGLLGKALDDEDLKVRQLALDGLVEADVAPALSAALGAKHIDVRVRAARALARRGDPAVRDPLLAMISAEEPEDAAHREAHQMVVIAALGGVAELGDPAALKAIVKLLDHKAAAIREAAAKALVWTVRDETLDAARDALRSADPQVKYRAALTLAYWGDSSAASLVFSDAAQNVLDIKEQLTAALALEHVAEEQLAALLDASNDAFRRAALALLLLLDLKTHEGAPQRCLAALSAEHPRARLAAARALECFADPARFLDYVTQVINDRGDQTAWTLATADVEMLGVLVAQADPLLRARTAGLLFLWGDEKQTAWDQAWRIHVERFEKEIDACRRQDEKRKAPKLQYDEVQLHQLAFGAYVGLIREQGGAASRGGGPMVIRVRQTALRRLAELAAASDAFREAAQPVLVQALGDPNQDVRMQAFDHLQTLGMETAALGADAVASGHTDLAVRGMKLLTEGASAKESIAILEQVMLSRADQLALEAAQLLVERQGVVKTAEKALSASWSMLPVRMVSWLAAEYDKDEKAKKLLHQALSSRFRDVRLQATWQLAMTKDNKAFDALAAVLQEPNWTADHNLAAKHMQELGDPRGAELFLDRIERDQSGKREMLMLFPLVGQFREPKVVPRLLAMLERKEWRRPAFSALLAISGYDQPLEDPNEERPNRDWLTKQHPRLDDVLARTAERCLNLGETGLLMELAPSLRWSQNEEINPILATMAAHSEPSVRHAALEAIGWRVRKRAADPALLLKALEHREAETKFHAAESLAHAGRSEGLNILLSAVDLISDIDLRRRAVRALGELADERSLDLLLKLAGEDGHALQEESAEAVGRMGKSEKANEIFKILERLAKTQGGLAASALRGLRHFNTEAGWKLVRERLRDRTFWMREAAAEALGYDDNPATRDALLDVLAHDEEGGDVLQAALHSARRLFGPDSLEPDYAILQNPNLEIELNDEHREALSRVCRLGEPARIFEILPHIHRETLELLTASLLNRDEPPTKEAEKALMNQNEQTVQTAAHVLGRGGDAKSGKSVVTVLEKWRGVWEDLRRRKTQGNDVDDRLTQFVTPCLARLYWAAGRLGAAEDALVAAANDWPGDPYFRALRLAAVTALSELKPAKKVLDALAHAAVGEDAEVRSLAVAALARADQKRAAAVVDSALSDHVAFSRLIGVIQNVATPAVRDGATQTHYQGVALPPLMAAEDVDGLFTTASNGKFPDVVRLGAIEALAKLAREDAEQKLVEIGQDSSNDEELRKAAWRGRRRSQRARKKATKAVG